ncbi:hypothetical protein EHS13_24875 [Paenibacillus psychroresistens]|uniref:Uncharacterized protein n=1 Tax=Paenibacillus psychroresistens TaxID=1778678 RepID=A0A6B8RPE0_9BACL|nr:endospore germination permease [Paenibacillus psychroresistens]QGQ97889.1 hypothetical protein EHS13_24875 [Paenibacillus psychroresistens]
MAKLENITTGQLGYLIFTYLFGFATLFLLEAKVVKQDVWMSEVLAVTASIVMFWLLCYIQRWYPGLTMMKACEKLLGKWLAKLVLLIFLYYFLVLGGLTLRALSSFYSIAILPNTPTSLLILLIILTTSYAVYVGLAAIARSVQVVLPLFVFAITVLSFFILPQIEHNPFLPQFQSSFSSILYGGMIAFGLPFGKCVAFGFIFHRVDNPQKIFITAVTALSFTLLYLLLSIYLTFGSLGINLTQSATFPFFTVIQLVKFGEYLERIEIIMIGLWTVFTLFETIVLQHVFTLVMGNVFGIKQMKLFILPIGLLFLLMGLKSQPDMTDLAMYNDNVLPLLTIFVSLILPAMLALITFIKKPRTERKPR